MNSEKGKNLGERGRKYLAIILQILFDRIFQIFSDRYFFQKYFTVILLKN